MLNPTYWEERWQEGQTGWDIGEASPPLLRYTDELPDKNMRILIPGAGRAYEAIHLHQQGFKQVYVCDWATTAFTHLRTVAPDFPEAQLIVADFFDLDLSVDLVLEQTFFCAIDPSLRQQYVQKAAALLRPNGRLAGVLFAQHFAFPGPPFGGTSEEYRSLFSKKFTILQMEISPYSIAPRLGNEFFVEMVVTK